MGSPFGNPAGYVSPVALRPRLATGVLFRGGRPFDRGQPVLCRTPAQASGRGPGRATGQWVLGSAAKGLAGTGPDHPGRSPTAPACRFVPASGLGGGAPTRHQTPARRTARPDPTDVPDDPWYRAGWPCASPRTRLPRPESRSRHVLTRTAPPPQHPARAARRRRPRELELVDRGPAQRRARARARSRRASRRAIAALAGRREGVACSSGTAGLHLGVRALGIGEGDEVITTPFSFVASANCLLYERAVPRFVDIEEDSLGLDPDLVGAGGHAADAGRPAGPRVRAARAGSSAIEAIARRPRLGGHRGRLRGARARPSAGGRSGASATSPSSPSTRTSRSRPARAAWS